MQRANWRKVLKISVVPVVGLWISVAFLYTYLLHATTTTYPPIGKVTHIAVGNDHDSREKIVTDKSQIAEITAFVDAKASGWGGLRDWAGVPAGEVTALFYDGGDLKGAFGVGANFFDSMRSGGFKSRHATNAERHTFLKLLGLDQTWVDKY